MQRIAIKPDFVAWRNAARELLAAQIPPGEVQWVVGDDGLFPATELPESGVRQARVPKPFLALAHRVSFHRDEGRWALLYRLLWRITHGEHHLLSITVDDDVHQALRFSQAVKRDAHKMKAFVRFRKTVEAGVEHFIAFHRPDHLIVPLVAPFFAKRFATMRWTILTPDASVAWADGKLAFGPGVAAGGPQDDVLEELWKTYYASIFNPARLKVKAMTAEMPKKHWRTLPEAGMIDELIQLSSQRVEAMMPEKKACPTATSAAEFVPASRQISALRKAATKCQGCPLYCNATQVVFGTGPVDAKVMFVGEQPGDAEDLAGLPFVGPAGQLLDRVLQEVGIDRSQTYVTNAVKHFKFEMRGTRRIHSKPSSREMAACKPWLAAEIESLKPAMIVCLGATAAQSLLGPAFRITQSRGKVIKSDWAPWLMATYHPSALLRMPDPKLREKAMQEFTADLRKVSAKMREKPLKSL